MHPTMMIYWPAVIVATVATFVFGFLWHGPLFGKAWCKEMGISMNESNKPTAKMMCKSMLLQLLGLLLMNYVLFYSTNVWRGSSWGSTEADSAAHIYGFYSGFFTWLGFYVPQHLGQVAWETRSWKLFAMNVAYSFISLQIAAQILACWRS